MITGYNTDVRHGNRIYHVQTEDKGLGNPRVETLIYVGGEILDSFRSSYEDLLPAPIQDAVLQGRMDEQHRSIIRDIKNGKFDSTPQENPPDEQQVFNDRPLDVAILEYLQQEGDVDTLELVMDEPLKPVFGTPFSVQVKARLCMSQNPVVGAEVNIRMVSSLKKTTTLLSGRTNEAGLFHGKVDLPPSQPGHCALLIGCHSDSGSDEVRVVITG